MFFLLYPRADIEDFEWSSWRQDRGEVDNQKKGLEWAAGGGGEIMRDRGNK